MILVYFPSGGCVDNVNNQTNHQFTSIILEHFMNSARVCQIIRRTIFNVCVCLNYSWRYERKESERRDENQDIKDSFLKIQMFLAFIRYTSLYTKQFYYFLETKICFVKKIVQYFLRLMYLFCPKISKILENHSIKSFWAAYYMLSHLVCIIFSLISMF